MITRTHAVFRRQTRAATTIDWSALPLEVWDIVASHLCAPCRYCPPNRASRACRATCRVFHDIIDDRSSVTVCAPMHAFVQRVRLDCLGDDGMTVEAYASMHVSAYVRNTLFESDEIVKDIEWLELHVLHRLRPRYASVVRRMLAPMYARYEKMFKI